ncbi:MAG: alpha/beta hydrolase [Eubacteriales bacterium]
MQMNKFFIRKMLDVWESIDKQSLAQQTLPSGIVEIADIPYVSDGNSGHLLDVYYPENANGKLPVIINLHGGGFVYGNKELNKLYGYHMARRGYIVFNLNYRLAYNDTKVPGQIQDVAAAVNWIGDNLSLYPADKDKIYFSGESAGGSLAIMTELISKSERLQTLFDVPKLNVGIKAAGINCGMMNLEDNMIGFRLLRSVCLESGYQKQEYYQNLIFENIPEMKDLPPVFLTTNDEDPLRHMTLNFEKTLKKNGVEYKLKYFKKKRGIRLGHVFSVFHPEYNEGKEMIDEMLGFFTAR